MGTRETFLALNGRQKIQFIWDYYRFVILGVIMALALMLGLVNSYVEARNVVLDVIVIGANGAYDDVQNSFAVFLRGESDDDIKDKVSVSSYLIGTGDDLDTYMALSTAIAAGGIDIYIGPVEILEECAKDNLLVDLRNIIDESKIQNERVYFYSDEETDKIPYAIRVTDDPRFQLYDFTTEAYCAVFAYGTHNDVSEEFMRYLVNE